MGSPRQKSEPDAQLIYVQHFDHESTISGDELRIRQLEFDQVMWSASEGSFEFIIHRSYSAKNAAEELARCVRGFEIINCHRAVAVLAP